MYKYSVQVQSLLSSELDFISRNFFLFHYSLLINHFNKQSTASFNSLVEISYIPNLLFFAATANA